MSYQYVTVVLVNLTRHLGRANTFYDVGDVLLPPRLLPQPPQEQEQRELARGVNVSPCRRRLNAAQLNLAVV